MKPHSNHRCKSHVDVLDNARITTYGSEVIAILDDLSSNVARTPPYGVTSERLLGPRVSPFFHGSVIPYLGCLCTQTGRATLSETLYESL